MSLDPEATPDNGNSAEQQQQIDWEQRYKDTQSAYTKAQQALREQEQVWADEDALIARLQQTHPHLFEDAEEPDPTNVIVDEPHDPRVDELARQQQQILEWQQRQEEQAGLAAFNADLSRFAQEAGVELSDRDRSMILADTLQADEAGPEAARAAFNAHVEYLHQIEARGRKRPRAPQHPAGTPPADVDTSTMSREELNRFVLERIQSAEG